MANTVHIMTYFEYCQAVVVWLGLGTEPTWLGLGKDHNLGYNNYIRSPLLHTLCYLLQLFTLTYQVQCMTHPTTLTHN